MTNNKTNSIKPAMKLGDNVKALKCVDWFQSIWHGGTWKLVFVMYLPILPILWLPAGDSINYVSSWRNLLQGIWLDRVPVSVSRMIIWIFCSDTSDHQRSFVLTHSLVMMSTSPVSTVIFPSETAMLPLWAGGMQSAQKLLRYQPPPIYVIVCVSSHLWTAIMQILILPISISGWDCERQHVPHDFNEIPTLPADLFGLVSKQEPAGAAHFHTKPTKKYLRPSLIALRYFVIRVNYFVKRQGFLLECKGEFVWAASARPCLSLVVAPVPSRLVHCCKIFLC